MRVRSVAAVFRRVPVERAFHAREDLAGESAAAGRVESDRRAGFRKRVGQLCHEVVVARVADIACAYAAEEFRLLFSADDVHEINFIGEADLVKHLSEI